MNGDVDGWGALVMGGASGLGAAAVRRLAAAGATVVIADRDTRLGEALAHEVGGRFLRTDVTDEVSVAAAVALASAVDRGLRIVVVCAGVIRSHKLVEHDGLPAAPDSFLAEIQINLIGSITVLRHAAAAMLGNLPVHGERGVVVLTSSIAANDGQRGQVGYSASKGGVSSLVLPAARELARHAIRVVAIAPGMFETPMLTGAVPEAARAALLRDVVHPPRTGDPAEFAALVAHIVANQMLNGTVLRLDGAVRLPNA